MIVLQAVSPDLRRAVLRSASPEEDVVARTRLAVRAIALGFPRLVVRDEGRYWPELMERERTLIVTSETLERWEEERRGESLPPTWTDRLTEKVSASIESSAGRSWADAPLAELSRAAGCRLPLPLRAFGRRILEFPVRYTSLHAMSEACGISRGALKARFRRRDLDSPSIYIRWFRLLCVAHLLADEKVSIAQTAGRLGFSSDGNMCRMLWDVAQMTPSDLRSSRGRRRLLLTFAWRHVGSDAVEAWASLDDLFERRVA